MEVTMKEIEIKGYIFEPFERNLNKTGSVLRVTIPSFLIKRYNLKKGDEVTVALLIKKERKEE